MLFIVFIRTYVRIALHIELLFKVACTTTRLLSSVMVFHKATSLYIMVQGMSPQTEKLKQEEKETKLTFRASSLSTLHRLLQVPSKAITIDLLLEHEIHTI